MMNGNGVQTAPWKGPKHGNETTMGSYLSLFRDDPFTAATNYLATVSDQLTRAELLELADGLHDTIRRRRAEFRSWRPQTAPIATDSDRSLSARV